MRRTFCLIFVITILLFLSACQTSTQVKPIKEETIDFDLSTAYEIIQEFERMVIHITSREKLTYLEYSELENEFIALFGLQHKDLLTMFFINNLDAHPQSDKYINTNVFYPTIFHEGIEITKAEIYKSHYENEFLNQTRLTITVEYVGDDDRLQDWKKDYIFTPNENGQWKLHGFSGVMNFLGEEFNMNYLKLND